MDAAWTPGRAAGDAFPEVALLPRELGLHAPLHRELRLPHVPPVALKLHGAEAHELTEVVPLQAETIAKYHQTQKSFP